MVQKDIAALSSTSYVPDSGTWYYIVFFLIGIVGYFCVPTVAGWIIEAGGGIGSYGRNVNSLAKGGASVGGKAMAAGLGASTGNIGGRIKGMLIKGK
jgi:conjugative transposon protein traJ